jgi:hypothetical protein
MKTLIEILSYQPPRLLDDEIDYPESSVTYFFKEHPLHVTRATIANFFDCWLAQNEDNMDGTDMRLCEMTNFITDLNHLIDLSYIISHKYEEKSEKKAEMLMPTHRLLF